MEIKSANILVLGQNDGQLASLEHIAKKIKATFCFAFNLEHVEKFLQDNISSAVIIVSTVENLTLEELVGKIISFNSISNCNHCRYVGSEFSSPAWLKDLTAIS